jgi:cell fate regulator YaaT (PSP1 superfamily)
MSDDEYIDGNEEMDGTLERGMLEDELSGADGLSAASGPQGGGQPGAQNSDAPPLPLDVPVYRLRAPWLNETMLAAWPGEILPCKTWVIANTRHGRDLAQVIGPVQRRGAGSDVIRIYRLALPEDLERAEKNRRLEEDAFAVCKTKIEARGLDMKLVSVHYLLEEQNILFLFAAENRVDFRDLIKDLVGIFKTRIELRQIGVRDEARITGGIGVCGRQYCCHSISDKLKPVSIKMAKDQNLALNSMKISGACGRLLCCLAYEHGFYSEQRRLMPGEGTRINCDGALWKVSEVNVAAGQVSLSASDGRQMRLEAARFEKTEGRWEIRKTQTG